MNLWQIHPERSKPFTGRNLGTLRLVIDLQQCVKAQQSQAYAQRVKLSNLQQMEKTVAYVQEHGYDTQEDLQNAFSEAQSQTAEMRKALRSTEQKLKEVNEQIHYTGQYLANKFVYNQFLKSKNKKLFRDFAIPSSRLHLTV